MPLFYFHTPCAYLSSVNIAQLILKIVNGWYSACTQQAAEPRLACGVRASWLLGHETENDPRASSGLGYENPRTTAGGRTPPSRDLRLRGKLR